MMRKNYVFSDASCHLCVIDLVGTSLETFCAYLVVTYLDATTFLKVYYLKKPH